MRDRIDKAFRAIDWFSDWVGKVVCYLSLALMMITFSGVIARYVFNLPFIWGFPLNRQIFGVFILFAGVYAMLAGAHLRVEIFYMRFPSKAKYIAGAIDLAIFIILMVVLIWQSGWMAGNSIINQELSQGQPKVPLYVIKAFIPVVATLFLLEGISTFFRKDRESKTVE
jgi:TRAP-type mannitol/chloroaromatic compound transport system permease small subunit